MSLHAAGPLPGNGGGPAIFVRGISSTPESPLRLSQMDALPTSMALCTGDFAYNTAMADYY